MKILEKFKSMSLVALAAIFLLSATLISCGDKKKEAAEDEATEAVIEDSKKIEHPSDSTHEGSEHPSNGGEHPTD